MALRYCFRMVQSVISNPRINSSAMTHSSPCFDAFRANLPSSSSSSLNFGLRQMSSSPICFGKDKREYTAESPVVEMGVVGEKFHQFQTPTRALKNEELFPTLETHRELFNGIRYDQIPICYIRVSKNNTIIDFRKAESKQRICQTSMSKEGFKNAKKKTTVAGQATGVAAALRALRRGVTQCRVKIRGLGPGRMSSVKGMTLGGMTVISITDCTKLPELGPRPPKRRRI